ncbi:hypothetical protein [Streptomyces sp. NPDC058620]|uniref:hypothetical protein n=1 Tax=Streptomyces sp. NPDC058620 TaxID=3346560 RepID=UPI00364623BA
MVSSGPRPETCSPGGVGSADQVSPACSTISVDRICGGFWWPVGPRLFALR